MNENSIRFGSGKWWRSFGTITALLLCTQLLLSLISYFTTLGGALCFIMEGYFPIYGTGAFLLGLSPLILITVALFLKKHTSLLCGIGFAVLTLFSIIGLKSADFQLYPLYSSELLLAFFFNATATALFFIKRNDAIFGPRNTAKGFLYYFAIFFMSMRIIIYVVDSRFFYTNILMCFIFFALCFLGLFPEEDEIHDVSFEKNIFASRLLLCVFSFFLLALGLALLDGHAYGDADKYGDYARGLYSSEVNMIHSAIGGMLTYLFVCFSYGLARISYEKNHGQSGFSKILIAMIVFTAIVIGKFSMFH